MSKCTLWIFLLHYHICKHNCFCTSAHSEAKGVSSWLTMRLVPQQATLRALRLAVDEEIWPCQIGQDFNRFPYKLDSKMEMRSKSLQLSHLFIKSPLIFVVASSWNTIFFRKVTWHRRKSTEGELERGGGENEEFLAVPKRLAWRHDKLTYHLHGNMIYITQRETPVSETAICYCALNVECKGKINYGPFWINSSISLEYYSKISLIL